MINYCWGWQKWQPGRWLEGWSLQQFCWQFCCLFISYYVIVESDFNDHFDVCLWFFFQVVAAHRGLQCICEGEVFRKLGGGFHYYYLAFFRSDKYHTNVTQTGRWLSLSLFGIFLDQTNIIQMTGISWWGWRSAPWAPCPLSHRGWFTTVSTTVFGKSHFQISPHGEVSSVQDFFPDTAALIEGTKSSHLPGKLTT